MPAADVPVPTEPAPAPMSDLFANYDPTGAMGGLFAPAYIKGFAPSEQAVAAWSGQRLPASMIDELRMPAAYAPPSGRTLADGVYGSGVPSKQSYLDAKGMVDPNALRAAAQGTPYDVEARRAAIAARIAENTAKGAPGAARPPMIGWRSPREERYMRFNTPDEEFPYLTPQQKFEQGLAEESFYHPPGWYGNLGNG